MHTRKVPLGALAVQPRCPGRSPPDWLRRKALVNAIKWHDVILTIVLMFIALTAFLYELAGETVPGWHTISYSAHRKLLVRLVILGAVAGLFVLLAIHFNSPWISR